MKKITQVALALCAVVGLVIGFAAPAGAAQQEQAHWLEVNNPTTGSDSECVYAYAAVDASPVLPGTAHTFATGSAILKEPTAPPCVFALTSGAQLPANFIKVKASMRCRSVDSAGNASAETSVWTSANKGNAVNQGTVTVSWAGFDGSGTSFPCQPDFGLRVQARTVVTIQVFIPPFGGYLTYQETTHWVDGPSRI